MRLFQPLRAAGGGWRRIFLGLVAGGAAWLSTVPSTSAADLCVRLARDGEVHQSIQAISGGALRLRFRHSIYGSAIQEAFQIQSDGLRLVELRYAEARLAEFYGHESAEQIGGAWIVRPAPILFRYLDLHVSAQAAMSVIVDAREHPLEIPIQPGAALRVTVAPCRDRGDG
ncbi:MAG: hypothetical protein ACREQ2_11910 [Candidatus Binatia bacterium]